MSASWDSIARALKAEEQPVSDVELAYRLDCKRGLVARVRADLGMAAMPLPADMDRMTPELTVMMMAVLTSGGHRRWIGRRTRDGVPLVDHFTTAARVVFRMEHGREPEGQVRGGCVIKHCVAWAHLTDRQMREDVRALDRAGGAA
ncbi:hypothetical protein ACIOHS_26795 [Streptomyces sp. NPDC088253]|uniref:hypothetical protein n=1 Tax=Streptomyces sp. NPDC088253 TaxID=3365846 RepID=UPI0038115E30